jgi:hypothetical protein
MADNYVVAAFNKVPKLGAGAGDILCLLLKGTLLAGPEERIAAKGDHCKFFHSSLLVSSKREGGAPEEPAHL